MATAVPSRMTRAEAIQRLAAFPQEWTIPLVRTTIRPREVLADLVVPSPAMSVCIAVAGTAASIALYPMTSSPFAMEPRPADLLFGQTCILAAHGWAQTLGHIVRRINTEAATDRAPAAGNQRQQGQSRARPRVPDQRAAEPWVAAQEQDLRQNWIELCRFDGDPPNQHHSHVRAWTVHASARYELNGDGSTSLYVPRWRARMLAKTSVPPTNVPMTRVPIGNGRELLVPTDALGNARRG